MAHSPVWLATGERISRIFKGDAAEPSPAALADDQMRSADTALWGRRRRVDMVAICVMARAYMG
jgi:hypothetical protein